MSRPSVAPAQISADVFEKDADVPDWLLTSTPRADVSPPPPRPRIFFAQRCAVMPSTNNKRWLVIPLDDLRMPSIEIDGAGVNIFALDRELFCLAAIDAPGFAIGVKRDEL